MPSSSSRSVFRTSTRIALLTLVAAATSVAGCSAQPSARNILLVTVDTLRADHLHSYGFPQPITPHIDALSARGVRFERAIAAASSTIPSHASIMTSRFAREHSAGARNGDTRLEGLPTLAQHFEQAGFSTAAFVSNAVLQRRSGMDTGFIHYDEQLPGIEDGRGVPERVADDTVESALAWLGAHGDDPIFLWVHIQDPHGPYTPPRAWLDRVEPVSAGSRNTLPVKPQDTVRNGIPRYQQLADATTVADYRRRYAAEVSYADQAIGRLAEAMLARGDTAIVLTSDHGESLGERGYYFQHAHATTPELARVPFVLVAPGIEAGRSAGLVHHVDIAPTLLELAGLEDLPDSSGLALGPFLRDGRSLPDRTVFCDTRGEAGAYSLDAYVQLVGPTSVGLDTALRDESPDSDVLTTNGLRSGADGVWKAGVDPRLEQELRSYVARAVPIAAANPSDETRERLRVLGYLGD